MDSLAGVYATRRTWIKDRVSHPLLRRYWPQVMEADTLTRPELLALQQRRLAELVAHAVAHVPFYRRWHAEHGCPAVHSIRLQDLPVATKEVFRAGLEDLQSDAYPVSGMVPAKTSGSSGEPFRFRRHRASLDYSYACMWRSLLRHGIRPGDRRVRVWGRSFHFNATPRAIRRVQRRHAVRDWMSNSVGVDAYSLGPANVAAAVDRLRAARPVYLHGYVSALYVIARHLLDTGSDLRGLRLKAAVTESEKLYPFQKEAMEAAFGCPVVEFYGCVELGAVAQTDPGGELLVNDDMYIVESSPSGEAIITDLFSHAFPFIRYRLGDLVRLGEGHARELPYSVLAEVVGRTVDLIPLRGGGFVHGVALAHVVDQHLALVQKYQVRQEAIDRFEVRLVVRQPLPAAVRERIAADLVGLVGGGVAIDIREVDDIAPAPSGKFRWVVSEVPHGLAPSR